MSTTARRERDLAARRTAIVDAARDLAEQEGWGAVTIRRLAGLIEYSQPVLYSHFEDKTAIIRAVALDGFLEFAEVLRHARTATRARTPTDRLQAVARAYLNFAESRPATYEAMFSHAVGLEFASDATPDQLLTCFAEVVATVAPLANGRPTETLAEVWWATMHGIATLTRDQRLPPSAPDGRLALASALFAPPE